MNSRFLSFELSGSAIGVPVNEFDSIKDPQVVHFRRNILTMCMNVVEEREDQGKIGHALYAYPPNLEASETLPQHIMQKLNTGESPYHIGMTSINYWWSVSVV